MAAVDPAAVETLRPLDLQLIKREVSPILFLFLRWQYLIRIDHIRKENEFIRNLRQNT
jgi:hypothetical protein